MPWTRFSRRHMFRPAHRYRQGGHKRDPDAQNRAMKRSPQSVLLLVILMLICGLCIAGQDRIEMPPDLLHVHHLGCHINARITEHVLNAKTKEVEDRVVWQVTPSAEYDPLPDGRKRDMWDASKPIFEMAGTIDDPPSEATEACSAWVKRVRAAANEEYKRAGRKK
jgi:hypothetical protein